VFCREHVAQLRDHQSEIEARGADLAAIGMGDFHYARTFREETGITFPLLIDVERAAYRAADLKSANLLHLLRRENAVARKRANAAGHRQHKLGENPFQLGASFVFGPGNIDRFTHISATFGDNASVADILSALSR
jgi:methylphosphotriester-DNA--protein-cysteine methyltransferase